MDALKPFTIPFQGLKIGIHQFEFQIDSSFFKNFEDSIIKQGAIVVQLALGKQSNMIVLDFKINGSVKSECDRCLENIDLPIQGEYQLMVKFSEEEREDTDEVIYINPKASHLELALYTYEYILLSVPIRKLKPACETAPEECETNMLIIYDDDEIVEEEEINDEKVNLIWSELNKFKEK